MQEVIKVCKVPTSDDLLIERPVEGTLFHVIYAYFLQTTYPIHSESVFRLYALATIKADANVGIDVIARRAATVSRPMRKLSPISTCRETKFA